MALFAVVVPMTVTTVVALVGRRLGRDTGGVGLLLGILGAGVGILGWPLPPHDAHHWVLLAAVAAGVGGELLRRIHGSRPLLWVGALGALLLSIFAWRLLAPLAGMWDAGVMAPIARTAWIVEPLAWALVAWLAVDHAERHAPRPAVLTALVVAFTAGAAVAAIGESARIGQTLGACAAACGALALVTWRYGDVTLGHGGVAVACLTFPLLVVYAHFYAEAPHPGAGLALVIPITALAGVGAASTLRGVLRVLLLAAIPAALAGYLAAQADAAKTSESKPKSDWEQDAADMYDMY